MLIKVFLAGWAVLAIAIVINYIAMKMGILTWYSFFEKTDKIGFFQAIAKSPIISTIFLFIIYPAILGFTAFITLKYLN